MDGDKPSVADRMADEESCKRFVRVCQLTDEMLAAMTPADRDRMRQVHLAAARGPARNLRLLLEMTDMLLELRRGLKN